jgi:hypothetical protein
VPSAQVELDHREKSLNRVLDLWHRKEGFRMLHEAVYFCQRSVMQPFTYLHSYFVMRSSIDRGSKMNVGSTTRLRSAPGRSCEII